MTFSEGREHDLLVVSVFVIVVFVIIVAAATQLTLSLYTVPYAILIALGLCGLRLKKIPAIFHTITTVAALGALSAAILSLIFLPMYIDTLKY